ncbi:enoyl-CoA hydratase/isomerase family protein [bacterium]|nr:MAG: enoyl-CoA hydratase/isomerase family protein [bacterium]
MARFPRASDRRHGVRRRARCPLDRATRRLTQTASDLHPLQVTPMKDPTLSRRTLLAAAAAGVAAAGSRPQGAQAAASSASSFRALRYETRGPVCVITLGRPEDDNVLDAATLRELPLAWEAFRADDALRVAIFTGAGDEAFCGGVDVTDIRSAPAPRYLKRDEGVRTYTSKQNKCWKPVIAAINGFVAGPGLHFLLDADICIAVPEATFFDVHLHRTGSVPVFEPIELSRKIPAEAVSRLFLLGPHDPLTAQRAAALGLISEVVPRARLMPRALEMAQQIAQVDLNLTTAFVEAHYKARELGVTEAINRGLIIRQATGYHDAPLKDRPLRALAVPGSKL